VAAQTVSRDMLLATNFSKAAEERMSAGCVPEALREARPPPLEVRGVGASAERRRVECAPPRYDASHS
jgi:hypothetical protein